MIRPAKMENIPNDFHSGILRCFEKRQNGREIQMTGSGFDQRPADALANRFNAEVAHPRIILDDKFVMARALDKIQPAAVFELVRRTFKSAMQKALKYITQMPESAFVAPASGLYKDASPRR